MCLSAALALSGCGRQPEDKGLYELKIETVYALAQERGFTGTLEDLIEAFKGDSAYEIAVKHGFEGDEADWLATLVGAAGKDGVTPQIGDNGNWWIGNTDTGVPATGPQGPKGDKGDKGDKDNGDQVGLCRHVRSIHLRGLFRV